MGASARQRPEMRSEHCEKTSALPSQKITGRQADQTSAWTHPERHHRVKPSAQRRPGVKWGLVVETAEEEQLRGCSAVRTQGMRAA